MILSPRSLHLHTSVAIVTASSVRELNDLIACKSARVLVARSQDLLRPYTRRATVPQPSPLTLLQGGRARRTDATMAPVI